jgi:nucleotide-binding universal stress UspA family protein
MYKKILVATDGSPYAKKAIGIGAELAKQFKSKVTLITVIHHPLSTFGIFGMGMLVEGSGAEVHSVLKKKGEEVLKEGEQQLQSMGIDTRCVLEYGNPGDIIVQYAKENGSDLIVTGSHGYGEVKTHLLGSVSDRVNHHAHCSVLIVR